MKASMMILLHLLLVVICCSTAFAAGAAVLPSSCCVNYIQKAIPPSLVASYQVTNQSACSMPGVIFITKANRQICADPTRQWVKDRMKMIDAKKVKLSPRAGLKALRKPLRKPSSNSTTMDH
ncbi:C-C motif chemokine 24 [Vombatus ursinus]|uniref:Chemokine interleukin-8-like domain-containing protein n=1 Tax=Vombatus ursinus TaxID=29139 RepID=A0A4X2K533_VOMUR|nr:C-C motif chemokine 24 [Vombatus ursinus]